MGFLWILSQRSSTSWNSDAYQDYSFKPKLIQAEKDPAPSGIWFSKKDLSALSLRMEIDWTRKNEQDFKGLDARREQQIKELR